MRRLGRGPGSAAPSRPGNSASASTSILSERFSVEAKPSRSAARLPDDQLTTFTTGTTPGISRTAILSRTSAARPRNPGLVVSRTLLDILKSPWLPAASMLVTGPWRNSPAGAPGARMDGLQSRQPALPLLTVQTRRRRWQGAESRSDRQPARGRNFPWTRNRNFRHPPPLRAPSR